MLRNRKIGPLLATVLVANNMIGSGIFLLPASLAAVGSVTMIGWLVAMLGAWLIAAVLAKLGQIAPEPGGPCAYAEDALGRYMGFQAYVIYWLCALLGNIAIAIAAVGYLAHFLPTLAVPLHAAVAATGLIWLLTLINIVGPRFACQVESVTLLVGLIPLLLTAQVSKAAAERGLFPAVFARVDRAGIPVINLALQAVLASAVVFATISPTLNQQFSRLIEVSVILCLLTFVYGCTAVWHFGRLEPAAAQLRGYRVVAFAAMLFCLGVIVMSGTQLLALTAVVIFATCIAYPFFMDKGHRSTPRKA